MGLKLGTLIAVVDDDTTVLESICDFLASVGYATICFATAGGLMACQELHAIDCLISDIRMPDVNGWQLASMLQEKRPRMPIILITAHDPTECRLHGHHAVEGIRILRKPFEAHQLLSAVRDAIGAGR